LYGATKWIKGNLLSTLGAMVEAKQHPVRHENSAPKSRYRVRVAISDGHVKTSDQRNVRVDRHCEPRIEIFIDVLDEVASAPRLKRRGVSGQEHTSDLTGSPIAKRVGIADFWTLAVNVYRVQEFRHHTGVHQERL